MNILWLVIQIVLIALSILLAPKPDIENARPRGLGDFDFPTATEGRPVPILWGTCRIKAPNVVWYGDLLAKKITEKISTGMFSSSTIVVGHTYHIGLDFAICEGPINALLEVEAADKPLTDMIFGPLVDPNPANTGNGTVLLLEAKSGGIPQTWTLTATNGGLFPNFSVTGSVSGVQDPTGVNTRFSNAHIIIEIRQGSLAFVTGDNFTFSTAVGGPFGGTGAADGVPIQIAKWSHFGGRKKGGGIFGTLQFYDGVSNQSKDSYLTSVLGTDVPGYVNVCHAVWRHGSIGENTTIREWAFVVQRFPDNLGLTGNNHIVNTTDANPAEVIYEILTNTRWGLGISAIDIDVTSFTAAGNTLATENNGFSMILDREMKAEDLLNEVLRQIEGALYQTPEGKFFLKLVRQDYVLASTPTVDETNILELREFTRGSWAETFNDVSVRFFDSTDDFKETFAMGQDLANFEIQGVKRSTQVSYPGIKHPTTARQVAMRELKTFSFPHAKVSLIAKRALSTVRPGDVIRFSWEALGISNMPCRVINVDLGELAEGQVGLDVVQDIFGVAETTFAAPAGTGWTTPPGFAVPIATELAFDSPYWFILTDSTLQGTGGERAISVALRPNGLQEQFRQFIDKQDGAGYVETDVCKPHGFTPTGTLVSLYAENTADIEASNLLVIGSVSADVDSDLLNAPPAEIETLGTNFALIDSEMIAFEQAVDNGNGTWTLKNVHRGMLDTLPAAHAASARVWVFHEGSGFSNQSYGGTATVKVKHVTETAANQLGLGAAITQTLVFNRRTERPLPAGFFRVNSSRYPGIQPIGDLACTWAHRNRLDPLALDQSDGDSSLGLPASHQYRLTFFNYNNGTIGTQLREQTQTGASYTYTSANQVADNAGVQPQAIYCRLRTENTTLSLNNLYDVTRVVEVFPVGTKAVDFNGTDETLLSAASTLGFANVWTFGLWVKREDADTNVRTILDVRPAAGNANRVIVSRKAGTSDTIRVQVYDSAGTLFKDHEFSGLLTASAWVHVVVAFDGSEANDPLRVYVGGTLRTPSATPTNTTGTMTDTSRLIEVPTTFDGRLHAIGAWSTELSAAEVTAIYNAGDGSDFNLNYDKNGYVSRATLEHWWRLGHNTTADANIGDDYALTPSPAAINVMAAAVNITAADDVVTDAP